MKNGEGNIGMIAVAAFALIVVWQWGRKLKEPRTVRRIERRPPSPGFGRRSALNRLTTRPPPHNNW